MWTPRFTDSELTDRGLRPPTRGRLPRTVIEYLAGHGYETFTCIGYDGKHDLGTWAARGAMPDFWMKDEPERVRQFHQPGNTGIKEWLQLIRSSKKFHAHIFLRETHRPWGQMQALYGLTGWRSQADWWIRGLLRKRRAWPFDAYHARRAALENPDAFAALRRRGLARADRMVADIFAATKDREDVVYVVYSNHGEVFDHFRYNQPYSASLLQGRKMIEGTSHGNYPYEVLYANMQMWIIPGQTPKVMRGVGRSIDFAPTVLALAGIRPPAMDGESMLPRFVQGQFPPRDRYAESPNSGGCLSMFRKDGYKFIAVGSGSGREDTICAQRGFANHQLAVFDLVSDPYEYVNLVDSEPGREVKAWAISRHRELKQKPGVEP